MEKKIYETPDMVIVLLMQEDIVTASDDQDIKWPLGNKLENGSGEGDQQWGTN